MKKLFPILMLALLAFSACDNAATTTATTDGKDSVPVVVTDSTPPVLAETTDIAIVNPDPADSATAEVTTGRKPNPNPISTNPRLSVSFISIGGGIDFKAKQKYDTFVIDFGKRNKTKLAHETVGWGREGEVDYCFSLTELKELQRAAFVEETKALFNGNELVQIKENAPCRKPRK
ncbi:MAG TPA: hypothetical protein VHS96_12670 [Bacteroidia bacterium]|jgi:hypothetical protein|nr:hypothetical protein [Bacteroidia bacterium]